MSYPSERVTGFRTRIWRFYRNKLWLPHLSNFKPATGVLKVLKWLADDTEKVGKDSGKPLRELEWDNVIILDAARHDLYQETINSEADSRTTMESNSGSFIEENFSQGNWEDTVVITANPFYNPEHFKERTGRELEDTFHTVFQVWSTDWNEEKGTVMPEKMIEKVETAEKLFPKKRKIIHFMQPHYPFIDSDIDVGGYGDAFKEDAENKKNIWQQMEGGRKDHEEVIQAYKDNFTVMKPHLEKLSEILDGETYVTADHGNLIGESGFYGHPPGSKAKTLRKVPWDKLENIN